MVCKQATSMSMFALPILNRSMAKYTQKPDGELSQHNYSSNVCDDHCHTKEVQEVKVEAYIRT